MTLYSNEFDHYSGKVYVDGQPADGLEGRVSLTCMSIERSLGTTPDRAILFQDFGRDVTGPVSLHDPDLAPALKYGQRVTVTAVRRTPTGVTTELPTPIFNGWLLRRSDQCASDKVIWQALDDRVLMQWIAMRGCLVYDPFDNKLRYSPRHQLQFNPNGFWNCTGFSVTTGEGAFTYPVFTSIARKVYAYEAPNTAYDVPLVAKEHSPWTPRRMLYYLQLWSMVSAISPTPDGFLLANQTSLALTSAGGFLGLNRAEITALKGYDPALTDGSNADPLDRKVDSVSLQGMSLLAAMVRALDTCGTHSLYNEPLSRAQESDPYTSKINYKLTGYAPADGYGKSIFIQRSGNVAHPSLPQLPNAVDFNFDEDATHIAESVLVEADVIRAETELAFSLDNVGAGDYSEDTTSDIIPAWSVAQEEAYLECIHGGAPASPADTYAKRAVTSGEPGTLEMCDGSGLKPLIWARSKEAIEVARQSFPTVYRAWRVNSRTSFLQTVLSVALGDSSGGLKDARPLLPEQLQFMTHNLGGGADVKNWLLTNMPIRVQLQQTLTNRWYEVPQDLSLRVTGDGTVWLDGIAEGASGTVYCAFDGRLDSEEDYRNGVIKLRSMRLNAAFPTDQRVRGFKKAVAGTAYAPYAYLSDTLRNAFYGGAANAGLARYQDLGATYRWNFQRNSSPCQSPDYLGGTGGATSTTMPLSRDVPPGSEQVHAEYAAQRLLARYINPHRSATFGMIGIATGWDPGDRINYVYLMDPLGTVGGNRLYYLRGCVGSVVHDFVGQQTTLGGLLGEYGSPSTGGGA